MAANYPDMFQGAQFGRSGNVPFAAQGAQFYANYHMGQNRDAEAIRRSVVNVPQARAISRAYQEAPTYQPEAEQNWRKLAEETKHQFDFLTGSERRGGLGVDVEVHPNDPYVKFSGSPDPHGMMVDLNQNRRIKVLSTATTGSHPFLTNDENDMFRAIHDVFGHAATGRPFDVHGEEAAYRSHASMFSPEAKIAMAAETRGQNSVNNFGGLPKGDYAEQKVAIIPHVNDIVPITNRTQFAVAHAQARRSMRYAFGRS
jgi:hypothetical protein